MADILLDVIAWTNVMELIAVFIIPGYLRNEISIVEGNIWVNC